ncbi:MAG TPA: hypothetical protein VHE55_08880 [Fimbriimonadaceae bacterium]|nr:hypothetical protein [Fimbriimonadaceae bacterium]
MEQGGESEITVGRTPEQGLSLIFKRLREENQHWWRDVLAQCGELPYDLAELESQTEEMLKVYEKARKEKLRARKLGTVRIDGKMSATLRLGDGRDVAVEVSNEALAALKEEDKAAIAQAVSAAGGCMQEIVRIIIILAIGVGGSFLTLWPVFGFLEGFPRTVLGWFVSLGAYVALCGGFLWVGNLWDSWGRKRRNVVIEWAKRQLMFASIALLVGYLIGWWSGLLRLSSKDIDHAFVAAAHLGAVVLALSIGLDMSSRLGEYIERDREARSIGRSAVVFHLLIGARDLGHGQAKGAWAATSLEQAAVLVSYGALGPAIVVSDPVASALADSHAGFANWLRRKSLESVIPSSNRERALMKEIIAVAAAVTLGFDGDLPTAGPLLKRESRLASLIAAAKAGVVMLGPLFGVLVAERLQWLTVGDHKDVAISVAVAWAALKLIAMIDPEFLSALSHLKDLPGPGKK